MATAKDISVVCQVSSATEQIVSCLQHTVQLFDKHRGFTVEKLSVVIYLEHTCKPTRFESAQVTPKTCTLG